ncbi:hypothetical protein BJP25_04430 [Actinokineospora bangkokensis]|uniref:DUF3558 domain-containing protein n=1 Tax=Actinokineospora bangkokensis TaxID=1193682 RepID=A0A1Q9LDY6_9PSEU|nr:hypothetical protein BJP25_04430 [Actinokineospora bangkokensis]
MTDAISTELGTGPAERARDLKYSTGCRWRVTKDTSATSYTLGVAIYPELGTDQINATGAKTPMSVNSRPAVQYLGAANSVCVISLEVTATSRVDVTANRAGSDGSEVCPQAKAAAELIEPELPPKG